MLGGALSTQAAAALAVKAFDRVDPVTVVLARLAFATVVLGGLVWLGGQRTARPAGGMRAVLAFGVTMAVMNSTFYAGIDRLPLGAAVTLEFWGPIAVAVIASRRRVDLVWVAFAAVGVVLLGGGFSASQTLGVVLILVAGGAWAAYIVIGRRVAVVFPGALGLAYALVVATLVLAPVGLAVDGGSLLDGTALLLCLGIGLFGSAVPYALDQAALRRVPARTFSVLLSLHPAVAAAVGFVALDQGLSLLDAVAIACVVVAAAGATWVQAGDPAEPPP